MSTKNLQSVPGDKSDDMPPGDYVDGNLIERDVTLSEGGIHLSQDYKIEEKGFKLHLPMYLLKSGVEVGFIQCSFCRL